MDALGNAVDDLVRDLYSFPVDEVSTLHEPEITSRLCQRLEDRLDGLGVGQYVLRVAAQSMPDRGPDSFERITGADLYLCVSLDGPGGFDKALFVQAKYDRNVNRDDLLDACRRMSAQVGAEGTYVWIYERDGVKVLSQHQVQKMRGSRFEGLHRRSMAGLTGRILDCHAGSQAWGIPKGSDRRRVMRERLLQVRASNGLDVTLKRR